jgi:hypothetical protein
MLLMSNCSRIRIMEIIMQVCKGMYLSQDEWKTIDFEHKSNYDDD